MLMDPSRIDVHPSLRAPPQLPPLVDPPAAEILELAFTEMPSLR